MADPQYWLVGAMFGGAHDQLSRFINRGYWYCWDPKESDDAPRHAQERFSMIKKGDRIAVKRLLGQGAKEIEIRAIGIVKDVDFTEWRIYVNWICTQMERRVPLNGCAASIHGPFQYADEWARQVFCL